MPIPPVFTQISLAFSFRKENHASQLLMFFPPYSYFFSVYKTEDPLFWSLQICNNRQSHNEEGKEESLT